MPIPTLTAPNPNIDLTSVDLVHQYCGITTSTKDDPRIQLCITSASYLWIWRTGRGLEGQIVKNSPFVAPVSYDEVYDGSGSYRQFLRNWPIVSLIGVSVSGKSVNCVIDQSRKSIAVPQKHRGPLGRSPMGCGFDEGIQNVEVSYLAGFSSVPPQIVEKCTQLVAVNYKRSQWIDQGSKSIGAQGVTGTDSYRSWEMPPEVRQVMRDFSREGVWA
jgi:hypothetical protein